MMGKMRLDQLIYLLSYIETERIVDVNVICRLFVVILFLVKLGIMLTTFSFITSIRPIASMPPNTPIFKLWFVLKFDFLFSFSFFFLV